MRVEAVTSRRFNLTAECPVDLEFIGVFDHLRTLVVEEVLRSPSEHPGTFRSTGLVLSLDPNNAQAQSADAGRKALGALGELFGLGLREAAKNGIVFPNAADPDTQVQLAGLLVELKLILAGRDQHVGDQKAVFEEVQRHGQSPVDKAAIVEPTGGAA